MPSPACEPHGSRWPGQHDETLYLVLEDSGAGRLYALRHEGLSCRCRGPLRVPVVYGQYFAAFAEEPGPLSGERIAERVGWSAASVPSGIQRMRAIHARLGLNPLGGRSGGGIVTRAGYPGAGCSYLCLLRLRLLTARRPEDRLDIELLERLADLAR